MKFNQASFNTSFIESLLVLSADHDHFVILNSNGAGEKYDVVAGFGKKVTINELHQFHTHAGQWKFGYFAYDLKNSIEDLSSAHVNRTGAKETNFFVPEIVITQKGEEIEILGADDVQEKRMYDLLLNASFAKKQVPAQVKLLPSLSKEEYISKIKYIKDRIKQGDIYEMNFCMEYFSDNTTIDPCEMYLQLNAISEAPFSCFARFDDVYVICSSPERFLMKNGNRLITQPIKGTAPRKQNRTEDEAEKDKLQHDPKEQNENVMIVDVSRNDLSRIAKKGSVKVEELFGVYSFKQVHQMISTVSCEIKDENGTEEIIRATFPPASMTGAPKIRAMQIIEETETFKRGIYSGTMGYIDPEDNFDLNVVIRTILYNQLSKTVSYAVGSAITAKCDPEKEYEECLLKAGAMRKVLEGN